MRPIRFKPIVPLFFAFLGILILSYVFAQHYILERIDFQGSSGSDQSPWYFIHRDIATAIANSLGILILLIITSYFRKKDLAAVRMVLFQVLIWMGYPTLFGIVILFGTQHIFDVESATTVWQTHEAYLNTRTIFVFGYLAILFIAVFLRKRQERMMMANA